MYVPELIPVLSSQTAGDVSHEPVGKLPLLSARLAVTLATLKRAATNFAAWWAEAQWVWTVCLSLLPDSVAAAIWTRTCIWKKVSGSFAAWQEQSRGTKPSVSELVDTRQTCWVDAIHCEYERRKGSEYFIPARKSRSCSQALEAWGVDSGV